MKISKWRWSSISISAKLQLKGTLALLLVGNVVFVIAQVRLSGFGGSLGFKMLWCLGWEPPGLAELLCACIRFSKMVRTSDLPSLISLGLT